MPAGERANFIVILVDDMGYDDIGLHHPRGPDGRSSIGAQTPNIDRLIRRGMSFTNFYSTPLCAMSRAELLTGRDFVRCAAGGCSSSNAIAAATAIDSSSTW
jgi:arylsulfatase A-like enzyme